MRTKRVISRLASMLLMLLVQIDVHSQAPQGFAYQAVVRNGSGSPIANQSVGLRVTLENASQVAYYTETHTTSSNAQGVISVVIGAGNQVGLKTFVDIPWENGDILIKLEIDPAGGTSYTAMGEPTPLKSVPYALYAENAKEIVSNPNAAVDDPIFEVKNKLGQVVFGVYQGGVRVYVEDTQIKGAKGGFAVGGLTNQAKAGQTEYFRITPDSARIWVKEVPTVKGAKGGFAVGGLINQAKTVTTRNLMLIAPDSARIWVNNAAKGAKGGFAVGGLINQGKSSQNQFFQLTPLNYFIGQDAGSSITTGQYNSFIGFQSGRDNSTGDNNAFMGYQAGLSNNTAKNNVFIGNQSGYSNKGGWDNVFLGTQSGYSNQNGFYNVFLGYKAGFNTNSSFNTFLGYQAGLSNTTGQYNAFMGYNAGLSNTSGVSNVFLGFESGYSNTTGMWNVFLGYQAGYSSNTQNFNTIIGYHAGYSSKAEGGTLLGYMAGAAITTGGSNTMIGNSTGTRTTTGDANVFIGPNAGDYNTTGSQNICIGLGAGRYNVSGIFNVMIGTLAGEAIASGNSNVMIGHYAGKSATGSDNVFIGSQAGLNETGSGLLIIDNFDNGAPLVWGDFSNNRVVIAGKAADNPSNYTFYANGTAGGDFAWNNLSDFRLKTNINTLSSALAKVMKLRGVNFEWKDPNSLEKGTRMGFIAQEAEKIIPEVVNKEGEFYSMQYGPIAALLVEAIKEQQTQADKQQEQISNLIKENSELRTKISEIESIKAELEAIKALIKK